MKSKITYIIFASALTGILCLHNISNLVTITDFVINQNIIAKTLCIQKDNQQGCNGKCHLRKVLAEQNSEDQSNSTLPANKRLSLDVYQISGITTFNYSLENTTTKRHLTTYRVPHISILYKDIDTPPPVLA